MKTMNKIQRLSVTLMMMLMATATWAYTVTISSAGGNPEITAKVDGSAITNTTDVMAGKTVILTVAEDNSQYLTTLKVQSDVPAGGATAPRRTGSIEIQGDVEVRQTGDFTYEFTMPIGNVTITPTFAERTSIAGATVTLRDAANTTTTTTSGTMTWQFDWLPHLPEVYQVDVSSTILTAGTDYTVSSFSSITNVEASNRTITITGKGKYNGIKTVSYNITPRSIGDASVQFSPTSFVYNKSHQAPAANTVEVYLLGQHLTLDTDYENVTIPTTSANAGTYTITVTGMRNFEGTASNTYTISKKPISECTYTGPTVFTYNGTDLRPTIGGEYQIKDGDDALTLNTDYTISYSAAEGESKDVGTYTMTITAKDAANYSGSKTITYSINSSGFAISPIANQVYTGSEIKPTIEVKDGTTTLTKGTHYDVIYSNNINVGTAKVYAVGIGSYNGKTGEATFNISPKSVNGLSITFSGTGYDTTNKRFVYNASTQKPTITVKDGETTLTENKDYTLVNNGGLNVGTAYKATITGIGNYTGNKDSENYSITALTYSNTNTTITLGTTDYVYDGTAKTPTVQQVKIGGIVIPSTDYTATPTNNTAAGTATVTIEPRNIAASGDPLFNLSGSASTTFTIAKRPISDMTITLSATSFTYNGSEQKPTITVKDGETTLTENTHYTLTWPTASTAVGSYSVTITGIGNYTGSVDKTYVINYGTSDSDITVTVSGTYTYNGTAYTPAGSATEVTTQAVVVKKGTTILTPSTDYTLSYTNNTNAGTATVTATGKGNYQFVQTGEFTIQPKSITTDMATLSGTDFDATNQSFVYNGALQKPIVTITDADLTKTLIEGTDYTLVNAGGTNVGTSYNATITGKGNYTTGTTDLVKNYSITALSLTGATVTLDPLQSYVYDGTEKRPGVQQVKVGNVVVPAADYAVTYPRDNTSTSTTNVNAGVNTAEVYINPATSNLSGSKTQNFSITKKPLTSEMITLSSTASDWNSNSFVYNGTSRTPNVTVSDIPTGFTSSIIQASDYTITNAGGTEVGVYYVTVEATATGNYSGTIKVPYSIVSDNSETDVTIALGATDDLTYTGNPITRTITVTKGTSTTPLTLNTDYEVVYNNNINVGEATITILGKGNYHFVKYENFNIGARPMTTANGMAITLSATSFEYNGSVQKPNVTVTYTKPGATTATTLLEGTDYTLSNPGATNVGTEYKAVISGIGNFTGTMDSPTYEITAKALTDAVITLYPLANPVYDGTAKEPAVQKVTVGGQVYTSGYTVTYANNINVKTGDNYPTVTVTSDGSTFSGSASTTFTIQPKPLTDDMAVLDYTSVAYDGNPKAPEVTVTDAALPATFTSKVLTLNTDYTVSYTTDHTTPGEKAATITGKGNYTGSVSKPYTIVGASGVTIDLTDLTATFTYNGSAHTPAVTVTKDETTLTLGTDYTVSYSDNINAGIATITVTGIGNYDFTQTKTFSIAKKAMTDEMVTLGGGPFTYNGNIQKPTVTVADGTLMTANDYTISNDGNINAGNFTVTVTATSGGNYSGSGSQSYTINPLSISSGEVNLSYKNIVFNGSEQKPSVQTVYANGHQLTATTDYTISWPGDDYTNQGVKTVTVTGTGNYKDSKDATYTIDQKEVTSNMIKIANENLTYTGSPQTASVTIEDIIGGNNIITDNDYTLTNPGGTAVGNYTVSIVGKGNYKGTATKQYSIVTAGSTGFTVDPIAAQDYTGLPLTPVVVVKKAGTTDVLTENTDYTLAWTNNINAGANTASVTVTGKGNYSGTQTVYFTITPKSLNATGITVTLSPTSFDYTGSTQKPTVTVKDGDAKTLIQNTDYTLVNDGGTAQGTYNVTITGIGNYKDEKTPKPTYTIGKQSLTGAVVVLNQLDSYVYDGNPKTPGVSEVKVGSTVIPASNYDVSYSDNVNAGTAKVTVTGKGNCDGSVTATFTITRKTVNSDMITISPTTFNYDGALHKPTTVTVKDGAKVMTEGTTAAPKDYLLTNEGGTAIGTYSVDITGQGNYTGTASKSYSIVANDASTYTIDAIDDQTYDGTAKEPAPVVKDGTTTLASNYYTCAYLNNVNAGTAVVTVTGKNGYTFVKSQTFTIKPKTLTEAMVALSATSFTYNGNVQKPTITVTDNNASGVSLITSNDYIITNEGGVNVDTYHAVVNGQNNYTGSVDKTFDINQLSLSTATITLATLSSYVYDGMAKTPAVQLVKVGELVVPATAYDVAYASNVNAGTAMVTVTAKASTNFKDGNSTTFNIERKDVTSDMIYLSSENLEFTGANIKPTVTVKDGTTTLTEGTATAPQDYLLSNSGGTAVGTYEVAITGQGNYKGTAKKQYSIVAKGATGFTVDEITGTFVYKGAPWTPAVTVKKAETTDVLTEGTDYTVAYTDNTNVGTATVTVTGKGNYSGTRTVNFAITAKALADGMVALSSTAFTYSGSEQKPVVTVTDTDTNTPLTLNTDYQVIYPTDAISQGTKTVTVKGVGNYTGEVAKTYTIGLLSLNDASVTLNELTSYVYDGTEKKPTVREVTVGTMVVPTTGYTVTYPDDVVNQGVKTMTITGTGNYTGKTTKQYTVTPKMITSDMMIFDNVNLVHTGGLLKPVVTVKDGGTVLKENTDYVLTNDGATEVGTYYVYITGKGNYTGNASRSYNIITQGASVFVVSTVSSVVYNGKMQEPEVTVVDNSVVPEVTLTKGVNYTVSYTNNKNAGTATVAVTGIGSYAGTVTKNFTIKPKALTSSMVTLAPVTDAATGTVHFTYNGMAQMPTVTVTDVPEGETESILQFNDYAVNNPGAINVGKHPVTVTGCGNYEGTVTLNYEIDALSIADASITLYQQASNVYTGQEQKPGVREVVVGTGANTLAVPTSGYNITGYANNVNVGTATVTITGQGNFTGTASTTFDIAKKPLTADMVTLDAETFTYTGGTLKPVVTVSDGEGDANIIKTTDYTVKNDGGTEVGEYAVTVTATTAGNYSGTVTRKFSIVTKGTATFDIALGTTSVVYDGKAKTPGVTVTDGGVLLTENDYAVAYADNVNVGTATVTVTGKGNYAGTKTATFEITPKPLTAEMVTLSATSFVYNAEIQKPDVTVKDGTTLTASDYVVTNNGGTHVGTFHVVVDGKGNYAGQVDKTFTITQLSIADAVVTLNELQSYTYDGKAKKPSVREVIAGGVMVPTTGYTVSYGENVNVGTATVTVTGQGDFKDAKTVTFDIVQKTVEEQMVTLSNYEYTYTGTLLKPEVTVRDGETTLTLNTDYTVKNDGGTAVGTYEVTVTGQGNYKGTASRKFVIKTKEAGVFDVTLSDESMTFTGSELQPTVTVKDGETTLTAGTHYTVAYQNNVNVGTATVVVTGQGQYEGQKSKTFLITPKTLTDEMVALNEVWFVYNALVQRPEVTVTDGTALTVNDYMVSNEGGQNVGTYKVTVTGRNNYTGTVTKTFDIAELTFEEAKVVLYQLQSYIYDGQEKTPGVREVLVGNIVVPSNGYTVTYSPNINVGTVTVTVTGQGNYFGEAQTTFEIKAKPVTTAMMTLTPEVFYYNGMNQRPAVEVQDGELEMVADTDYTLTNEGGVEAGLYDVILQGMGNYTGEAVKKFTILSSGVNTFTVILAENSVVYNGEEQRPAVTVMKDEQTLTEGTDYTVEYANNKNVGTATVVVTGLGDYEGSQVKTFVITPKALTDDMVTLDKESFTYTGEKLMPVVTVSDGDIMTVNDYVVTNNGGTEEGTYEVKVEGKNNYTGTVTKTYTIVKSDINVDVPTTGGEGGDDPDVKDVTLTLTGTGDGEGDNGAVVTGVIVPESDQSKDLGITIPATVTVNGQTYQVTGLGSGCFAGVDNLSDIYLPDTEEPLTIGENAIPANTKVHTPLALLDDYALMPTMAEHFKAGKVMTTVTAKNRYWTFSCGVDVCVPDGVTVYAVHERSNTSVALVQLTEYELMLGGQPVIKANNGVLIAGSGGMDYTLVASAKRMTSGTQIGTYDSKDYGPQNLLVPVIVPTHFESGNYYVMKDNQFRSIKQDAEDVKVPACKAVLYLESSSPQQAPQLTLDIFIGEEGVAGADENDWYDVEGRKLEGRPTTKGVYIHNKQKIVIK